MEDSDKKLIRQLLSELEVWCVCVYCVYMCVCVCVCVCTACVSVQCVCAKGWGKGRWVGPVCTFWYECPLVVLACESLRVRTVCI